LDNLFNSINSCNIICIHGRRRKVSINIPTSAKKFSNPAGIIGSLHTNLYFKRNTIDGIRNNNEKYFKNYKSLCKNGVCMLRSRNVAR
jgi:hypothetical protein